MKSKTLTAAQFAAAQFLGVYREPSKPNQRIPVRLYQGDLYDLFGRPITADALVRVDVPAKPVVDA